jgi:hypothetical protein
MLVLKLYIITSLILVHPALGAILPPDRDVRVWTGFHLGLVLCSYTLQMTQTDNVCIYIYMTVLQQIMINHLSLKLTDS